VSEEEPELYPAPVITRYEHQAVPGRGSAAPNRQALAVEEVVYMLFTLLASAGEGKANSGIGPGGQPGVVDLAGVGAAARAGGR